MDFTRRAAAAAASASAAPASASAAVASASAAPASASAAPAASFTLPDGWRVEEKPRASTKRPSGHVDKFYIEPVTGKKFRSLKEVQRHLNGEEVKRKRPTPASCSRQVKRDEQPVPWYDEPAQSVRWVLQSFKEPHVWKAYIDGREVPASVSREWQEEAQEWEAFRAIRKFRKLD